MAVNNNDIRVKRTKKLIRHGLAEISKSKSITKISVKELTDFVEINRGTFYLHYKDIADLVDALENELYEELDKIISSFTIDSIINSPVALLEACCVYFKDRAEEFGMLTGVHGDAEFTLKISDLISKKSLEIYEQIFPIVSKEKYDLVHDYCKFGMMGLIYSWFTKYPDNTPKEMAETWLQILTTGLLGFVDLNKIEQKEK